MSAPACVARRHRARRYHKILDAGPPSLEEGGEVFGWLFHEKDQDGNQRAYIQLWRSPHLARECEV